MLDPLVRGFVLVTVIKNILLAVADFDKKKSRDNIILCIIYIIIFNN